MRSVAHDVRRAPLAAAPLGVLALALGTLFTLGPTFALVFDPATGGPVARALLVVACVAVVAAHLLAVRRGSLPTAVLGVLAGVGFAVLVLRLAPTPSELTITALGWLPGAVGAPPVLATRRWGCGIALGGLAAAGLVVGLLVALGPDAALDVWSTPITVVGCVVVRLWSVHAERALLAARAADEAALFGRGVQRARSRAVDAMARTLHDTVLSALVGVGLHDIDGHGTEDASGLRAACASAARQFRELRERAGSVSPGDDLGAAIAALAAQCGLRADVSTGASREPSAEVRAALLAATRQVLVNVARHAGVDRVTVVIDRLDERLRVVVRDEGCGYDPSGVPETRFGWARSVVGRLADLGGSATVSSRPGAGTTIELVVPLAAPAGAGALLPRVAHRRRVAGAQALLIAAGVAVVDATTRTVTYWSGYPRPAAVLACLVVVVAIPALLLVAARREGGVLPRWAVGALAVVVLVVDVAMARLTWSDRLFALSSWVCSSVSLLVVSVAAVRPVREVLTLGALHAAVMLGLGLWWASASWTPERVGSVLMIVVAGLAAPLGAAWFVAAAARSAQTRAELAASAHARACADAQTDHADQIAARWLAELERDVLPFLDAVGAGRLAPGPQAAARAHELATALRARLWEHDDASSTAPAQAAPLVGVGS